MAYIETLAHPHRLGPAPAHAPSGDVDASDFAFHSYSSPYSLKSPNDGVPGYDTLDKTFSSPPVPPLQSYNYNFSASKYDESSASASNTDPENDYTTGEQEEEIVGLAHPYDGLAEVGSSRSSISSLPMSSLPGPAGEENIKATTTECAQDTSGKPIALSRNRTIHRHRSGSLGYKIRSPYSGGNHDPNSLASASPTTVPADLYNSPTAQIYPQYSSGFRNPSSLRAMQMRDESVFDPAEDDDDIRVRSLSHHRRNGSARSVFSRRSGGSAQTSPTKSRRNGGSPLKQSSGSRHRDSQTKTEFPLVLLHCALLPPTLGTLSIQGNLNDEALLKEVLPDEYWRRWRLLKEKMVEDVEVRDRGVLVAHPRAEYEMLEERLLESLELERARIKQGHYLQKDGGESRDDDTDDDATINAGRVGQTKTTTKCLDCGNKISMDTETERRWEIKVYAANGLMRAGAWSAAWSEMEKVDVEVGVWMPEEVRRGVEEKLAMLRIGPQPAEEETREDILDEAERRRREIYGVTNTDPTTQEKVDGLFDEDDKNQQNHPEQLPTQVQYQPQPAPTSLQVLLLNYCRGLMEDRRNIIITLLSFALLFYAMHKPIEMPMSMPPSANISLPSMTDISAVSPDISTTTVTSIATTTAVSISTTTVAKSVACSTPASEEGDQSAFFATNGAIATQFDASSNEAEKKEETKPGAGQVVMGLLLDDDGFLE